MKKTLRSNLLRWYIIYSVIILAVFLSSNSLYIRQKTNISDFISRIYRLHLDVQKEFNLTDAFLSHETSNPSFYEKGESPLLKLHREKDSYIQEELSRLTHDDLNRRMKTEEALDSFKTNFAHYKILVNQLVELSLEKGFKDYGTVGKMREEIHKLENYENLDQTYVLGLRRHEKDYIIRNEDQYVEKLNKLTDEFSFQIRNNSQLSLAQKSEILSILQNYNLEFNNFVRINKRIGVKYENTGLKSRLLSLENTIEEQFNSILERAELRKKALFNYMEVFYILFFLAVLIINISLGLSISKRVSAPLTRLTAYIKNLSDSKLSTESSIEEELTIYETSVLYREFTELIDQVKKEQKDLKAAQAALIENEEKYRQLADHLPQSVFETDQFGYISYLNSTGMKALGYSEETINTDINISSILHTISGPITLGDEKKGAIEYMVQRTDGSFFPALVFTNRINRNNRLIGFRGVIIDITERKQHMETLKLQKEQAEKSDQIKSEFLANMSHKIRTPMNSILGFSRLLSKKNLDDKTRNEFIRHIITSGNDLLKLIDNIIDRSRNEAGTEEIGMLNEDNEELEIIVPNYSFEDKKILIVDDDQKNFIYLSAILKPLGVNLLSAYNGMELMSILKDDSAMDLILLDITIPGLDGISSFEKIRDLYPKIPVIAQTADAMDMGKQEFLNFGFDDFIVKPIDDTELLHKIAALLSIDQPYYHS